ncbi:energy transducer TonB [Sorangium sp. So ce1036]|uniref:energy transducer TonB n=1 Tax=Sorangium sp. So ce1036 TaxID=3133328 RepID=UPI003F03F261
MGRLRGLIATLLMLSAMTATACDATTSAMPAASQPGARRVHRQAGSSWTCAFPEQTDMGRIDGRTVVLRVYVDADGTARAAQVLKDPGNGLGEAAAQCAMIKRYVPARDRSGAPVAAWTPPISVHYRR